MSRAAAEDKKEAKIWGLQMSDVRMRWAWIRRSWAFVAHGFITESQEEGFGMGERRRGSFPAFEAADEGYRGGSSEGVEKREWFDRSRE
ncbi:hypothetical protein ACLOJK_029091 [Asimina triloba]